MNEHTLLFLYVFLDSSESVKTATLIFLAKLNFKINVCLEKKY